MVIIEGWPTNIPFCNFNEAMNSLTDLKTLLQKWHCGKIYWREVTETEVQDLDCNRDNQIEGGELEGTTPRRRRSDHAQTLLVTSERSTIRRAARFLTVTRRKRTILRAGLVHWILKVDTPRSSCYLAILPE